MEAERRRSPRMRTLLAGVVAFNNRCSTFDCTIRNASDTGALLKFPRTVLLPPTFELEIPARNKTVKARIVWRSEDAMGVAFDNDAPAAQTELLERLKASEAAKARLQERVRLLTES
ncbi:PilZ domain-containing protein [Bosea sp. (in: a-proteobacteria)]|nr:MULTISPECIES: PilZ domain-containing protein [unclassified Bosea (in: a-proteobacteria)]TAJ28259.1 MAG: PilZ domain-containing protein [Bosea sp. (in: a-proteobacteria)]